MVKSINDTTSVGTRLVTVKRIYSDSVSYDSEQWKFIDGKFFVTPSHGSTRGPIFDTSITKDTLISDIPLHIGYKILNINIFENNYYGQKYIWSYVHQGGSGYQYETANKIGITFTLEWSYPYLAKRDSFKLKGILLNGVLLRDSTFTVDTNTIEVPIVPKYFSLSQNYPNPFNPATTITYQIPQTGFVTLKVYDILGREIATLVNKEITAGSYEVQFTANGLTSGIYFYQLKAGDPSTSSGQVYSETKKMILIR